MINYFYLCSISRSFAYPPPKGLQLLAIPQHYIETLHDIVLSTPSYNVTNYNGFPSPPFLFPFLSPSPPLSLSSLPCRALPDISLPCSGYFPSFYSSLQPQPGGHEYVWHWPARLGCTGTLRLVLSGPDGPLHRPWAAHCTAFQHPHLKPSCHDQSMSKNVPRCVPTQYIEGLCVSQSS